MRYGLISLAFLATMACACVAQAQESATVSAIESEPYVLSAEDKRQLHRVEEYLGKIHSITARFSQVSPDGNVSNGMFYLQRPGKMRMEYEPPVPVLVVTNGNNLVYYDKELEQITNISLNSTLVGFLAHDKITFDNTVIVTQFEHAPKMLRVGFVQTAKPKDGMMTLEFADEPMQLRNIIITDSAGQSTVVSLSGARLDEKLDPDLFIFKDPNLMKGRHIRK